MASTLGQVVTTTTTNVRDSAALSRRLWLILTMGSAFLLLFSRPRAHRTKTATSACRDNSGPPAHQQVVNNLSFRTRPVLGHIKAADKTELSGHGQRHVDDTPSAVPAQLHSISGLDVTRVR